jgi:tRNA (guanine-N1)-methyltransferase
MKAQPAIDAVESIIKKINKTRSPLDKGGNKGGFVVILPSPAKNTFTQKTAHSLSNIQNIIFVCTRYEGIDYRFEQYMKKTYKKQFQKVSL